MYGKDVPKKKWKPKAIFPLSGRKDARAKELVLNDIEILAKYIFRKLLSKDLLFKYEMVMQAKYVIYKWLHLVLEFGFRIF